MTSNDRYVSDFQIWLYAVLRAWGACEDAKVVLDCDEWDDSAVIALTMFLVVNADPILVKMDTETWWMWAVERKRDPEVMRRLCSSVELNIFSIARVMIDRMKRANEPIKFGVNPYDFFDLLYPRKGANSDLPF